MISTLLTLIILNYTNIYSQDTKEILKTFDIADEKEANFQYFINIAYGQNFVGTKIVQPNFVALGFTMDDLKSPICLEINFSSPLKKSNDTVYDKYNISFTPCFKMYRTIKTNYMQIGFGCEFGAGFSSITMSEQNEKKRYFGINALSKFMIGFTPKIQLFLLYNTYSCKSLASERIFAGISYKL